MTQFDRAKKLSAEIVDLWVTQHGRGVIERWFAANPARLGKEWAQSGFLEFFFAATAHYQLLLHDHTCPRFFGCHPRR